MRTVLTPILTTNAPLTLHLHLGRASHAPRPRLTGQPAPDERRPFTCSTFWSARRQGRSLALAPDATGWGWSSDSLTLPSVPGSVPRQRQE